MRTVLLITIAALLLACGREAQNREAGTVAPPLTTALVAPPPQFPGIRILEQEVLYVDLIVRARLMNEPEVHVAASVDGKHHPGIKFNFSVLEVLKGTYAGETVHGIWVRLDDYDARADATAQSMRAIAERDTTWDDREAILFLRRARNYNMMGPDFLSAASHYLLGFGSQYYDDEDRYSLNNSRGSRIWLPASNTGGQGADREFLLTPPPSVSRSARVLHPDGESTTLRKLKKLIADVLAEYNGGDGSQEYKDCVDVKYGYYLFYARNTPITYRVPFTTWKANQIIDSGQPANTTTSSRDYRVPSEWDYEAGDTIPPSPINRFLGRDAHLFTIGTTPARTFKSTSDVLKYDEVMQIVRPLPMGVYELTLERRPTALIICNFIITEDYMITVVAPEGVLHEVFFDPVTVGTAVLADDANGQLKPASFTGANGSSATIETISWEAGAGDSGALKVEVDPDYALAGHVLDFIELDGSVSLSLDVFSATVDAVTNTLTWSVPSQPWHDGDKLMVRVREAPPSCNNSSAVASPYTEPALVGDCKALLDLKDDLAGTASLNWSLDTAITSWDGVTVGGTPRRVTELSLESRNLTGSIPSELEGLDLQHLYLSGNSLTGCIPSGLRDIANNDLDQLELQYCS